MTETEVRALLDAHDALVKAYVDSSLEFFEFASAYDGFPNNYSLGTLSENAQDRAILRLFRGRIAFHLRVSGLLSVDIASDDAGRFLPAVVLMRLRDLLARHPDFCIPA